MFTVLHLICILVLTHFLFLQVMSAAMSYYVCDFSGLVNTVLSAINAILPQTARDAFLAFMMAPNAFDTISVQGKDANWYTKRLMYPNSFTNPIVSYIPLYILYYV
jgi:hypothetical protein